MWMTIKGSAFQELPDHGEEGLEPVHEPLQGLQLGPRSVYLLFGTWVGESSPGSLGIWC